MKLTKDNIKKWKKELDKGLKIIWENYSDTLSDDEWLEDYIDCSVTEVIDDAIDAMKSCI